MCVVFKYSIMIELVGVLILLIAVSAKKYEDTKIFQNIVSVVSWSHGILFPNLSQGFVGRGYNSYLGNPRAGSIDPGFEAQIFEVRNYQYGLNGFYNLVSCAEANHVIDRKRRRLTYPIVSPMALMHTFSWAAPMTFLQTQYVWLPWQRASPWHRWDTTDSRHPFLHEWVIDVHCWYNIIRF